MKDYRNQEDFILFKEIGNRGEIYGGYREFLGEKDYAHTFWHTSKNLEWLDESESPILPKRGAEEIEDAVSAERSRCIEDYRAMLAYKNDEIERLRQSAGWSDEGEIKSVEAMVAYIQFLEASLEDNQDKVWSDEDLLKFAAIVTVYVAGSEESKTLGELLAEYKSKNKVK